MNGSRSVSMVLATDKMSLGKCHCLNAIAALCARVCVWVGGCMLTHTLIAHPVSRRLLDIYKL